MMKLLIILVLLTHVIADISKEEFVKKLNEMRLEMAKREKIPNMHEMIWNDELASRIGGIDRKSDDYYRLHYHISFEREIEYIGDFSLSITRNKQRVFFDFLNPTQTDFGCGINNEKLRCLLKPIVGMLEKEGEPGSDCKEGFENHGGLCRRVGGETTSVEATPENSEFVEKVNEMRLELAKRRKIPNMREMVWSDEIASRIGEIEKNSEEYEELCRVVSYEEKIQSMNDTATSTLSNAKFKAIDFLNPTQTHFGCGLNDGVLKCMSKPRVGMFEKKGEPGSDCKEGFENHGGLCGRIIPTTRISTLSSTTTFSKLKKIPAEKEKKEEKMENNSSSFHLFVVFLLILWIFIE